MFHPYRIPVCLTIAWIIIATPVVQAETGSAIVQKVVTSLGTNSKPDSPTAAYQAVNENIDFNYIAETSLGRSDWSQLNTSQKRQYVIALHQFLERRFYPRWHKLFTKYKFEQLSESQSKGETLVQSKLSAHKKSWIIVWRLRSAGNEKKLVNLTVNGQSLLDRVRSRMQKQLARGGRDRLIVWLSKKSLKNDGDDAPEPCAPRTN